MTESNPMHWNLGGWLGAQLGGTVWILVAGILSFRVDGTTAMIAVAVFILANIAGLLIWRKRDSFSPYAGIQMLLPIIGAAGLAAVYVLDRAGIFESIQIGGTVSARSTYGIIIVVVALLMFMFYFQFGRKH